jgi:glycosyltransferase involved in cell wall biosynthesis
MNPICYNFILKLMTSMAGAPFFSIVIPSRNRPDLLDEAIQSVLLQSFQDYELIISNNGDPLDPAALKRYLSHDHISYRVSPGLTMEDHWEKATLACKGEYVLLLTDRCLLCNGALASIEYQLQQLSYPDLLSWRMRLYLDSFGVLLEESPHEKGFYGREQIKKIIPFDLRTEYLSHCKWSEILPRGLNCAAKRSLLNCIRSKHGRAFFSITPDISFAMACLLEKPNFYFSNSVYYISRGQSSGGMAYSGNSQISTGNTSFSLIHAPCKAMMVSNIIIEDYLSVNFRYGHLDAPDEIDLISYYSFLSAEFKVKMSSGLVSIPYLYTLRKSIVSSALASGLDRTLVDRLFALSIFTYSFGLLVHFSRAILSLYLSPIHKFFVRLKCKTLRTGTLYSSALQAAGHSSG